MKNVVRVVCCVGCEKLLKLCKNVEVVKNVVVVVFFEKCGNDLNCVEMI